MRVTRIVAILTSATWRTFAMKSAKSERFLQRRLDLPREVAGRPSAWPTASAVSWARCSNKKGLDECLGSRVVWLKGSPMRARLMSKSKS